MDVTDDERSAFLLRRHGLGSTDLEQLFVVEDKPVVGFATHGELAVNWWLTLRGLVPQLKSWPVILGTDQDVEALKEQVSASDDRTMEILAASEQVKVPEWFRSRGKPELDGDQRGVLALWPDAPPTDGFSLPFDSVSGSPHECVWIGLIPGLEGWVVPAVLRFGNWNDSPSPAEHVAVLRYWNALFGAELVAMSSDVIEAAVSRPPTDQGSALLLGSEQFAYCPDVVTQGAESIERLAATLLGGSTWYFWWD